MISFSKRKKNMRNSHRNSHLSSINSSINSDTSSNNTQLKNQRRTSLSNADEEKKEEENKSPRNKLRQIIKPRQKENSRKNSLSKSSSNSLSNSHEESLDASEIIDSSSFHKTILWTSSTIVALACIFALGFGFYSLTNYVMSHPYFEIKRINIAGSIHFTIEEVVQLSGIEEGANIFTINLNEVESRMLQNPWIENVSVKRQLPDTYNLSIKERTPSFWVRHASTLYYVDKTGKLIAPVEPKNFISLPIVELGMGPEAVLAIFPNFLEELQSNTFDLPFTVKDIAWFRLSAAKGIEMFWEQQGITFSIAIDDWHRNTEHIALTIKDLKKRNELNRIFEIHAGNEQVWYTPN